MITQERLKERLAYCRETGSFTWKSHDVCNQVQLGQEAGWINAFGYREICLDGKCIASHRLAWLYEYGEWPKSQIDHINQIKTDNRIENLRDITQQENLKNKPLQKNNKHGVAGVHYSARDKRWIASIKSNGKQPEVYRGKDFFEACCARKSAENRLGYHANHGKPIATPRH